MNGMSAERLLKEDIFFIGVCLTSEEDNISNSWFRCDATETLSPMLGLIDTKFSST